MCSACSLGEACALAPDPPACPLTPRLLVTGCLDGGEYLAAARRYGRAAEVHRALVAGGTKHVAQRFPLLQHQWPLVKKFRPQVSQLAVVAWMAGCE